MSRRHLLSAAAFVAVCFCLPARRARADVPQAPQTAIFGWEGDKDAAIAEPDGSFTTRDGLSRVVRFQIYAAGTPLEWSNASGYLPALVTTFDDGQRHVVITNFADRVTIGANDYVIAYSRVAITNVTSSTVDGDPRPLPTAGLVALTSTPTSLAAGATANHDYAIVIDRFGRDVDRPADAAVLAAGAFDAHYQHMQKYWDDRLAKIVTIRELPDRRLVDAMKAGFIYTHIVKDGLDLNVGENGYDVVYDHDLIGILSSLFVLGDFQDAHALLDGTSKHVYDGSTYRDASWKFSVPWALYLQKTGDIDFVRSAFATIKSRTRTIAKDRTGPGGIMRATNDVDTDGYWTADDWAALLGLASYRWLATELGEQAEADWASAEYDALFEAIDGTIAETTSTRGLTYLPCSPLEPNDKNRCGTANDANWMALSIIGSWAWDGWLWGARQDGTMIGLIDATYDFGLQRLASSLPPHTYGGYPGYGTAYNAGYGITGLRGGGKYRSEALLDYVFMIENGTSGPYSWWEGELSPKKSAWQGNHPASGTGSCPHIWGQSFAFRALVDSLVAEKGDGTVVIGRGVPVDWTGKPIVVDDVPVARGKRMGFELGGSPSDVTLKLTGDAPLGNVRLDLPAFAGRICHASAGTVHSDADQAWVEVPAGVRDVTVHLDDGCSKPDTTTPAPDTPETATRTDTVTSSCGCRAAGIDRATATGAALFAAPTLLALLGIRLRRRRHPRS